MSHKDTRPTFIQAAESAAESARTIAHNTGGEAVTGGQVYDFLGELKMLPDRLSQGLIRVSRGLERSLQEFDVYEDDGGDPAKVVSETVELLALAADLSEKLGTALEAAQAKIALQGNRGRLSNSVDK